VEDHTVSAFIKSHPELEDAMFNETPSSGTHGFTLKPIENLKAAAVEVFDLSALEDDLDAFDAQQNSPPPRQVQVETVPEVVDLAEFDEPLSPQDESSLPTRARAPRIGPKWGPDAQSKKKKNISGVQQIQVVDLTQVTLEQLGLATFGSSSGSAQLVSDAEDPNVLSAQTRLAELFDAVKDEYFVEEAVQDDNFRQVWKGRVYCAEGLVAFKQLLVELEESLLFAAFYSLWSSNDLTVTMSEAWRKSVFDCQTFSEFACLLMLLKEMIAPKASFGIWNSSRGAAWSEKVRDWIIYSEIDESRLKAKFLGISFTLLVNSLVEKCETHGVSISAPPHLSSLLSDSDVDFCKQTIFRFGESLPEPVFKSNWSKRFQTWSSNLASASADRAAALLNVLEGCLQPKFRISNAWAKNCEAIMGIQLTGVEVVKDALLALAEQLPASAFIDNWKSTEAFAVWDGETFAIEGYAGLKNSIITLEKALKADSYEQSWSSEDEKGETLDIAGAWRHSLLSADSLPQICTWLLYFELKLKRDVIGEDWATKRQAWYSPIFEIAMENYLGMYDFVKSQTFVMYENIRPNFRTQLFQGLEVSWLDQLGRCTDGNIQVLTQCMWNLIIALETPGQHRSTESKRIEWKGIMEGTPSKPVTINQLAGILANFEEHILWDAVIQWWRLLRPQFIANLRWIRDAKPFTN
jgi:hypothetical protein